VLPPYCSLEGGVLGGGGGGGVLDVLPSSARALGLGERADILMF